MLTRDNLRGIFAAVPIPWDEDDRLDEATFREDVARLCESGVQGIYTTGSTGEFYALDFAEFRQLVDAVAAETRGRGVLTQVGCTWMDTRGAARRAAYAAGQGVDAIQIGLPFWMALSDDEVVRFFREVASAAGGLPLIHYNTARSKRVLGPREYARILDEVPSLIGCKFTGADLGALSHLLVALPDLVQFVGETILTPGMVLGARGNYSALALMNPRWMVRWHEACAAGDWDLANRMQQAHARFSVQAIRPLIEAGYLDAGIDKAMIAVTRFLKCPPRVRGPYSTVTEPEIAALRRWVEGNLPELLDL